MMKNLNTKIVLLSILPLLVFSKVLANDALLSLNKGFSYLDQSELFDRLIVELNRYPTHMIDVGGEKYYAFSGTSIGLYRVSDTAIEWQAGWPLTRWAHEYLEPKVESSYVGGYFSNPYSRDYIDESDRLTHLMGCMQRTPLRYGDVTGDGQSELVALLADPVSTDILLFSPSLERIIFSAKLNLTDAIPRAEVIEDHRVQQSDYQFVSWRNFQSGTVTPALRAYAKLYVGDFDESGQPDMVVWSKQYDIRHTDDAVEGFILSQSTWLHYTLIDGEYQPVETDEATIQGWLSAQNLTWSQGYPRYSECEGEEGQLIPEMHDPLLNDPDVLQ